jgi:transcriptional repressor NrdR
VEGRYSVFGARGRRAGHTILDGGYGGRGADRDYDDAMKCPFCGVLNKDRVLETRTLNEGASIKRRRECEHCGRRFTTMEEIEELQLFVVKNNDSRVPFDRNKIVEGMRLACKGRKGIEIKTLEDAAADIERMLYNRLEKEVPSREIGELVMDKLKVIDQVAYVRFASVYRQFEDATQFKEIVNMLRRRSTKKP